MPTAKLSKREAAALEWLDDAARNGRYGLRPRGVNTGTEDRLLTRDFAEVLIGRLQITGTEAYEHALSLIRPLLEVPHD